MLGCRRSGTSILGRSIGAHRQIAYLHEPRALWFSAFPQSDIWTEHGGRIVLDERDWTQHSADILTAAFADALKEQRRPRLCEKLPINCFRVDLINRIFPDALFIHIEREPLAVARSIAEKDKVGKGFSKANDKWGRLIEVAKGEPEMESVAAHCETALHKGLFEWALSAIFANRSLDRLVKDRMLRISYAGLTARPAETLKAIEVFAKLEPDPDAIVAAADKIRKPREPEPISDDPVASALLAAIAAHGLVRRN
ncbi:MAG TPA: sulfotransferase [Rhizomicrobium sp.]